ncbi:MAG: DUF302 domain-containing protein [Gammaproteobacteria bacterium]|nr:DUF302 domain-containing protein [Gammaproteobacteria bacterium]
MKVSLFLKIFFSTIILLIITGCESSNSNRIYQQISPYSFEDTLINLDIAISEHNYRIIHRSNIGQAVRDRGQQDFPLSTITNFCNISYAKEMMEINPNLINEMPCTIAIRQQDNAVIVSTKLMATNTSNQAQNDFAVKINNNLKAIIEATIE